MIGFIRCSANFVLSHKLCNCSRIIGGFLSRRSRACLSIRISLHRPVIVYWLPAPPRGFDFFITLISFPSNHLFDLSRMLKLGSLSIPLKGRPPKLFGNHSLLINGDWYRRLYYTEGNKKLLRLNLTRILEDRHNHRINFVSFAWKWLGWI